MHLKKSFYAFTFASFITFAFGACKMEKNDSEASPESEVTTDVTKDSSDTISPESIEIEEVTGSEASVKIETYVEYPEGIDGCACYFAKHANDLTDGKYVFMTNYEKLAYMLLDGKMRTFTLLSSEEISDGRTIDRWSNEDYEMVVKATQFGQMDETWQHIGTINVKPKDKPATQISVTGECGC